MHITINTNVIDRIQKGNTSDIPTIIKDVIKQNSKNSILMKKLWKEYAGDVPIKRKKYNNPAKPNNKTAADFRGIIVQQITGYMFGNPIRYVLKKDPYGEKFEEINNLLQSFLKRNNFDTLDSTSETYLATCGQSYRLLYYTDLVDTDNDGNKIELVMRNIQPWQAIVINDGRSDEPVFGIYYYEDNIIVNGRKTKLKRVEFYDAENVFYFVEDSRGNFVPEKRYGFKIQLHGFDVMPLIQFDNNQLLMGDFEKVRDLIDSYDKTLSSALNDSESFANAYLLFYGMDVTPEVLQKAKDSGALEIPKDNDADANNDVKFLTKDIMIDNIIGILTTLESDIFRFSQTINMDDEKFSGASQTGESRKYKLIPLETKAVEKERLYTDSLRQVFKIATTWWKKTFGVDINYMDINYIFTRALPLDLGVKDLILLKQSGILSAETVIENLKIVENPKNELERIEAEQKIQNDVFSLSEVNE